jgi:hypothetical protein
VTYFSQQRLEDRGPKNRDTCAGDNENDASREENNVCCSHVLPHAYAATRVSVLETSRNDFSFHPKTERCIHKSAKRTDSMSIVWRLSIEQKQVCAISS